ncbi:MAG: PqqD family protein [Alphaproteobacteria bacterium]|nr:PqqD family protein [Alphaproteobacteria bacterium]
MDKLRDLAISPTGFVFDPVNGATFTVNTTGALLIEGIRDGLSLDDLLERVEARFDLQDADLRRDVLEFVRVLQDEGLLTRDFELE